MHPPLEKCNVAVLGRSAEYAANHPPCAASVAAELVGSLPELLLKTKVGAVEDLEEDLRSLVINGREVRKSLLPLRPKMRGISWAIALDEFHSGT